MSKRILVVEDQEDNRQILRDLLGSVGYQILEAEDGARGVAAAEAERPDLILMDIQLPLIDGYEATRRIRDLHPELPVIGLTAHALPESRRLCLEAGMVEHVVKPIDMDELAAAICRHVRDRD